MNKLGWETKLDGRTLKFRKASAASWCESLAREVSYFLRDPWFKLLKKFINHELVKVERAARSEFRPRARRAAKGLEDFAKAFHITPESADTNHQLWLCPSSKDEKGRSEIMPLCDWRLIDCTSESLNGDRAAKLADRLRSNRDKPGKKFRRLERKSEALMRVALVFYRDGWALVPARTRKDE